MPSVQVRMDNKTTAAELDAIAENLLKCCIDVMTITKHNLALQFRSFITNYPPKALVFDSSSAVSDLGFTESETGASTRVLGKSASWIFIFFNVTEKC
ncbi:hypothetical protein [Arabidopsis thaliana]|uniref:Uncharacterized protein AT4g18860 n=1 Tax=Arabidopsis thaliana TaxID=3702 RepID=O49401_ARATH|nr:uncharacterized protein AT4G18860 [Arabidopsis thaliana]AEE84099.1 hypothetical protein AT4G18860 [Arabidopsis thaliana]CAA16743.2 hypothetical protein [Arabidopsis thaliana]CAB78888.1 hypothetical protein [Arabidopsis thaliana]|eukprot:NP_193621.1 hypothetical protein AT4G18860 [Arabidopsis thaliana]